MNFDPAQMMQAGGIVLAIVAQALVLYVVYGALEKLAGDRAMDRITRED